MKATATSCHLAVRWHTTHTASCLRHSRTIVGLAAGLSFLQSVPDLLLRSLLVRYRADVNRQDETTKRTALHEARSRAPVLQGIAWRPCS